MTQESILGTIAVYGGLVWAHEAFDFLSDGEFADARAALVVREAIAEIEGITRKPK